MGKIDGARFVRAFQQLRALCLLALILVHAFSYTTGFKNYSILNVSYLPLFGPLIALNAAFIFISGVTFRIALDREIRGDRLISFPWNAFKTLFALIVIEGVKNYFVYKSIFGLFVWDFLRTILVVALFCIFLSRRNVYLTAAAAVLISFFFMDIRDGLMAWLWRPEFGLPNLDGLNAAYFIYFGLGLAALIWFLSFGLKKNHPRLVKLSVVTLGAGWIWLFCRGFPFDLSLDQFAFFRNLPMTALVGDDRQHTLFPIFSAGPSFLLAFSLTHFTLKHKSKLKTYSPWLLFWVSFATWIVLIYILLVRHTDWILSSAGTTTWSSYRTDNLTSFAGEIMKSLTVVTLVFALYLTSAGIRRGEVFVARFGAASFWVYVLATTFTGFGARVLSPFIESVHGLFFLTATLTIVLSLFITRFAAWFESHRLTIAIRRHRPTGWTPLELGVATIGATFFTATVMGLINVREAMSERIRFIKNMDRLSESLVRSPESGRFNIDGSPCTDHCPVEVQVAPARGSPDQLIEFHWSESLPAGLITVRPNLFDRRVQRRNGEYILKPPLCPPQNAVVGFDGPDLPLCVTDNRIWP